VETNTGIHRTKLAQELVKQTQCTPDTANTIINLLQDVRNRGTIVLPDFEFTAVAAVLSLIFTGDSTLYNLQSLLNRTFLGSASKFAYLPPVSQSSVPAMLTLQSTGSPVA
jgi:hypothetical protein